MSDFDLWLFIGACYFALVACVGIFLASKL